MCCICSMFRFQNLMLLSPVLFIIPFALCVNVALDTEWPHAGAIVICPVHDSVCTICQCCFRHRNACPGLFCLLCKLTLWPCKQKPLLHSECHRAPYSKPLLQAQLCLHRMQVIRNDMCSCMSSQGHGAAGHYTQGHESAITLMSLS